MDKERKIISLLVIDTEKSTLVKSPKIIKFPFPICKECGENMKFELEGYKIRCAECPNFHACDMLLKEYENYQKIDISKILCDICSTSKYKTYNNQMYLCNTCKIQLCPLCKNKHDKNHKTINYDLKNYICPRHNESYISFCKTCNINICFNCQIDHNMHDIILFGDILPNKDELCIKLIEFKDTIDEFNESINKIIDKFLNVQDNLKILYNIYNDMLNKFSNDFRNYEIFMSLNNINNNKVMNDLYTINKMDSIKNKVEGILNIYDKMNYHVITMIYNTKNNEEQIRLFGQNFYENNKNLCSLIYENKEYKLNSHLNKKNINSDKLIIKLKGINKINSMKAMFYECNSLESLPDISNFDTKNIKDMSYLFFKCSSLKSLPDISKWNTSKVTNMSNMFGGCNLLKSLPDISKWDTSNVTLMSSLFASCKSLIILPDISKWNTSKVINIRFMFHYCTSLISLPDISKWNTANIIDMNFLFFKCKSLSSLPDISKWNISNVINMSDTFYGCSSLSSFPDISKWNTKKVNDIFAMFSHCNSLSSLPNLYKLISQFQDSQNIFFECFNSLYNYSNNA